MWTIEYCGVLVIYMFDCIFKLLRVLFLLFSHWLFVTPWSVAHQTPLTMGFPRLEYLSGLPFPFPGDLPDQGIEPTYLEPNTKIYPIV